MGDGVRGHAAIPGNPEKTVCFTGHRNISEADIERVVPKLDGVIEKCILNGYNAFITGGALGFDTVAAFRVLAAKERHPEIKLYLALPCRNQTVNWTSLKSLKEYRIIKDNADFIVYVRDFYDEGCMMERNRLMVDSSAVCVGYVKRASGGSAATMRYAEKMSRITINLA